MTERCAVYYVPPANSTLWQRGCDWLGRDAETGRRAWPPRWLAPQRWRAIVTGAEYYGLHGTLKAPFRPVAGVDADDVARQAAELARTYAPFHLPPLDLAVLHDHIVLGPRERAPQLEALALDCVHRLDHLRAPEPGEERRHWGPWRRLTPLQRQLLSDLGYPYTGQEFWFHITLTGVLTRAQRRAHMPVLRRVFAPVLRRRDIPASEIAVFRKTNAQDRFELYRRIRLGAAGPPQPRRAA